MIANKNMKYDPFDEGDAISVPKLEFSDCGASLSSPPQLTHDSSPVVIFPSLWHAPFPVTPFVVDNTLLTLGQLHRPAFRFHLSKKQSEVVI
jgi:hypothetical protein